jgi:hypothetical protein
MECLGSNLLSISFQAALSMAFCDLFTRLMPMTEQCGGALQRTKTQ